VEEATSIDRSDQLALDVAGVVKAGGGRRFDLDVERQAALSGCKRCHYDKREAGPECVGRADDERRSMGCWFARVWLSEVNQP
jgi:hypothetical protein